MTAPEPGEARDQALRARTRVALARLRLRLAVSRRAIGEALADADGLTFVRSHGNTGDRLIEEGIRVLMGRRAVRRRAGRGPGERRR